MQKQEVAFTAWLNSVLMPVHATAVAREATGMSTSTEVRNCRVTRDTFERGSEQNHVCPCSKF